jgi:hypothetical protein
MHLDSGGGRAIRRLLIAAVTGWLVSWLAVGALITLSIAWPHNWVPRVLLVAWAVLAAVSLAIPGSKSSSLDRWLLLVLAAPAAPFTRAATVVWSLLPKAFSGFPGGQLPRSSPVGAAASPVRCHLHTKLPVGSARSA